ncbi:phosphate ABC transporter substrate-binding protein [Clostridium felsineum]|uniref:Phosphate-binding protein n=1 Tax=Clostridium felsineum TaxID=36839 RepID=A0A1S8LN27_9CLOT|nr:phosphate ABC transporter substrate-binding protein [Clostridium felsineum]MCR3759286.1 phosphate ABC transporter substrate-binding protein [Clostridium felsineum]URZ06530.1 Phosphate-binding protein PstS 1 [Clostridium felsineum]URZ11565.1 Phosphate-binding protein PstS 1 [Clostridium felsineum]
MKSKKIKLMAAAVTMTIMASLFVGCSSSSNQTDSSTKKDAKKISGSITLSGSTALQPLAEKSVDGFKEKNPDVSVNVQGGGSGTGLNQVLQGAVEIGNSDIFAEEKLNADDAKKLTDHKVCAIGFAVVTSSDVTVKNLTKQQVQDIFTGKVTNWSGVGGPNEAINIVHRPKSSGTRATFTKTVMDGKDEKDDIGTTQDASGSVKTSMTSTKGSISYLAFSYLVTDEGKKDINMVSLDGVEPTSKNVESGKYPFWSYEHMYTKGKGNDAAKAFIDYMMSSDNKALIEKMGYISSSDIKK